MKALDVSPTLIGTTLRVEADNVTIVGQLQDLGVITEQLHDGTMTNPHSTTTMLEGVVLNISGHELRLTGTETITIIQDGDQ